MTNGSQKKSRSELVAGLDPVPKIWTRFRQNISRMEVVMRVGLCMVAALVMIVLTAAWSPPFEFREGDTPVRTIVARVEFSIPNTEEENQAKRDAKRRAHQVYENDESKEKSIKSLRSRLSTVVGRLSDAKEFDEEIAELWERLLPRPAVEESMPLEELKRSEVEWQRQFDRFRFAISEERKEKFNEAVARATADIEQRGLLDQLANQDNDELRGDSTQVIVFPKGQWTARQPVDVNQVLIPYVKDQLKANLQQEFSALEEEVAELVRREARQTYILDPQPLITLRGELKEKIDALSKAEKLDDAAAQVWREFLSQKQEEAEPADKQKQFVQFRKAIQELSSTDDLAESIREALTPLEQHGFLEQLAKGEEVPEGHLEEIYVDSDESGIARKIVKVEQVRIEDVKPQLRESLEKHIASLEVAGRVFAWLEKRLPGATTLKYRSSLDGDEKLPTGGALADRAHRWFEDKLAVTLSYDSKRHLEIRDAAADEVRPEEHADLFAVGDPLALAGVPMDKKAIHRLLFEYDAVMAQRSAIEKLSRTMATFGMYLAIYTLCGLFILHRYPVVLADLRQFSGLLLLSILTVAACIVTDHWKAELIPLLLFGMTVAIAYNQELALLVSAAVGLVVVLSLGHGMTAFVILMAAAATAILLLRRVRSRVKLVYVGLCAGTVAMLTTVGVNIVDGQVFDSALLTTAGLNWLWGVAAGFMMTGLLPFVEAIFGVLTDLSLLELGDVAHPLLQELVRRAPGTYNHSINVASMAEAAADNIGANGLLVRVGAYFHDIGKMLKPQYFVENQGQGDNQHESLVPAMSTLIIIAHVKDGADLARQHHLPRPVIDFIQQHHGTTLVEYFYRRASEKSQDDPDAGDVDENTFRYPGPKPQSKEAGVLMLADAVESASRVLVEPTPARIESLVEELSMKRLLDGQLDQSGLTLQEVRTIQDSLIKSLTAVYHGRVKYPDQKTA